MQAQNTVVQVVVFAPVWNTFDYVWPQSLGRPEIGLRIVVPFGHGQRLGVVAQVLDEGLLHGLKLVFDRFDLFPLFSPAYFRWLARASAYYLSTMGEIYELSMAWAAHEKQRRFRCLDLKYLKTADTDLAQAFQSKRAVSVATIFKYCKPDLLHWRVLQALEKGFITEVVFVPEPYDVQKHDVLKLRDKQKKAVSAIMDNADSFYPMLLFGCTGSGKTEVYLQAAQRLVASGKQVLILVPEIGLTPLWMKHLLSRFEHVAIWHSGLTTRERIAVRHQLKTIQVLLGTRSSLFLPLENLGMIVIDEEHDTSFKQQDGVMYSARDLSLLLAQELGVPIVMGSATPSLEAWRQVKQGDLSCFRLTERVYQHAEITPEIIDMRGSTAVLSSPLLQRLKDTHSRGEQSILYLNRRGYAPALQCTSCGEVPTCKRCSLRLTLHRREGLLRCHVCDYQQRVNKNCHACGEQAYLPLGSGTERLEDDLLQAMPDLKLARFDRDVIRHTTDLTSVLSAFSAGEVDCLLGTQMLVKGHHFPNVTLVGVVNADLGMNLPDFRASERWWQQMTQVFGRTGRGEQAGQVVVQTWSPEAPWFERLDESKAEAVLNDELALRQLTTFPPYGRWVRVVFSAVQQAKATHAAFEFSQALVDWHDVKFSGPMPCALERLAGRFRVELIVRDESRKHLPWKLLPLLQKIRVPSGVRRKVDVDPQDLM